MANTKKKAKSRTKRRRVPDGVTPRISVRKMERGFHVAEFQDRNGEACSIQESSALPLDSADEGGHGAMLWLGVDDAKPQILVPGKSWQPYPIPEEVLLTTRMHLSQANVRRLLPLLQHFAKYGTLPRRAR